MNKNIPPATEIFRDSLKSIGLSLTLKKTGALSFQWATGMHTLITTVKYSNPDCLWVMTYDSGCSYRKQSKLHVKACLWRSKMRPEQVEVTPIEGDRVFYSRTCTIPCQNFVLWCISCWCNVVACVSLSWKVQVGTLHHLLVFPKNNNNYVKDVFVVQA
jgi:hypothetical protein